MKITNLLNNKGNNVPNQFEIRTEKAVYFQSYQSIIVKRDYETKQIFLDKVYWNYSKTTSKYRNLFLCEDTKETERKIKAGIYILTNLN